MAEPPAGPSLATGTEFAGYRIEGVVGEGGMGVVYRATKLALDRERALKVIAPALSEDARFRERFRRESRIAASIEHPNVIPVHDAGEEDGMLYLAMRLIEGRDLHRVVATERPLAHERVAAIVAGVASALDAAHAEGLVHRDVKPANVLIEAGRDGERVYLTDFGITRRTTGGDTVTGTGEFIGSVEYVAPEQAAGETIDARTDVYALGGVANFTLTGRPPFPRDNSLATLFAHANAPRPRPSQADSRLPAAVDAVIAKAMAPDPAERHASAGELAVDVARALGVEPAAVGAVAGPPPPPPTAPAPLAETAPAPLAGTQAAETRRLPGERRHRRGLLLGGILAAAAIVLAVVVVLALSGGDDGEGGGEDGSPPVDAPKPKLEATIDLGDAPNGLTVGEESKVWVAEPKAGEVEGIDTDVDQVVPPSATGVPGAASVAVGFGSIWAVSPGDDAVYRLDPAEGTPPEPIEVGDAPSDVAIDENGVWVSNEGSDTVSRVDPVSGEEDATEEVGDGPRSIATGGGSVWVANIDGRSVVEIDSRTAKRTGSAMPMGARPNDLAYGEDGVWVIDNIDGTLSRISPDDQEVSEDPIPVGDLPRGVKVGYGFVWVANGGDGNVIVVDPTALEVVAEVKVGKDPADIAIGEDSVWTADQGDSTVSRVDPGTSN